MKKDTCVLLFLLLLIAGCDSAGPELEEPPVEECVASISEGLQPLSTEHSWEYYFYSELLPNSDQPRDTVQISYSEMQSIALKEGLEQPYQRVYSSSSGSTQSIKAIWSNGPDGLYTLGLTTPEDTLLSTRLVYPYPAQVGATTQFLIHARDNSGEYFVKDSSDIRLIAVDEELETPAGTFRTHVYRYLQPPPSDDISRGEFVYVYFAPGIGYIGQIHRQETVNGPGEVKTRFLLSDYCLKEQ